MSVKLYVGNISHKTTGEVLRNLFGAVGSVLSSEIMRETSRGRRRHFAFVEMASKAESENAIAQLHGHKVDGRQLTVSVARATERGGFNELQGEMMMADPRAASSRHSNPESTDSYGK